MYRLEELYCVDVEKLVKEFSANIEKPSNSKPEGRIILLLSFIMPSIKNNKYLVLLCIL